MSAMVPAEDCEFPQLMQQFDMNLVESSWYQSPVTDAAQTALDPAAYYEQLAFMLEAQNLAFQMAQAFPFGMPDEQTFPWAMPEAEVPEWPPGLDSIAPPPGLEPMDFGSGPELPVKDSLWSCAANPAKQHPAASDSASTRLGEDCSSGDDSSSVSSSKDSKVVPPVPTPEESPHPWRMKKGKLLAVKAADMQTESCEPPPVLRQICYFQNRWHNKQDGEDFQPCGKGDDCMYCHEIHPLFKRRNDKFSRCSCPVKHL